MEMPQTLVRVGIYEDSLDEAVGKFREPMTYIKLGLGNTVKYATFNQRDKPYLLIVSQQKDRILSAHGYNSMLTVTSRSDSRNNEVANQFERETGIDLNVEVPELLKGSFAAMVWSFEVFEKNPRAAMEILRG